MDALNEYWEIIKRIIRDYATFTPARGNIQVETIFDESNDHYELMYAGWNGPYRIHGPVLHLDIRGGKVWIQSDGTEDGVAGALVAAGIPHDRIVLAFKAPESRQYTDFAVG